MPSRRASLTVSAALVSIAVIASVAPLAAAAPSIPPGARPRPAPAAEYLPDEVVVRLRANDDVGEERGLRDRHGLSLIQEMRTIRVRRYRVPPGRSVEEAVKRLRADPRVALAEPNYVFHANSCPQDPLFVDKPVFPNQWGFFATNLPYLWRNGDSGLGVLIAIIDTGTQYTHPDLAANVWTNAGETPGDGLDNDGNGFVDDVHGWDFVHKDNDPDDDDGHGTHVTGIACAASNALGVAGVAYQAHFMPVKVLDPDTGGSTTNIAAAIMYAAYKHAQVINMSLGSYGKSDLMEEMCDSAYAMGCVLVAATGNDGVSPIMYPSRFPNVISVGNLDTTLTVRFTSNYGPELDVIAPGARIWSTYPPSTVAPDSGTSMATPFVSGICALLIQHFPQIKPWEVRDFLQRHARDVDGVAQGAAGNRDGYGLVSFGTLKDYSNGGLQAAWSLNSFFEWLGKGVSGESSLNDNGAVGANDGDDYMPDLDGISNSALRGDDAYDDGLFPLSHPTLPWLSTHLQPAPGPLSVELATCNHSGPRYAAGESLTVRAWADWNSDNTFTDPQERLTNAVSTPRTWAADNRILTPPMTPNENHFRGNPLRVRTRLYGPHTPISGPFNGQSYGEVEDQQVLNFVESFDTTTYVPPPFADLGSGWRIILDDPAGFPFMDPPPHHNQWHYAFNNRQSPCPNPESGRLTLPEAAQPPLDVRELTTVKLRLWSLHSIFLCATCDPSWQDNCRLLVLRYDSTGVFIGQTVLYDFPETNDAYCGGPGPTSGTLEFDLSAYVGGYIRIAVDHSIVNIYDSLVIDDVYVWGYDENRPAMPTFFASSNLNGNKKATINGTHPNDNAGPTPSDPNISLYQARLLKPGDTWATAWRLSPRDFSNATSAYPPPGTVATTFSNAFVVPSLYHDYLYGQVPQDEVSLEPASSTSYPLSLPSPLVFNVALAPQQPAVVQGTAGAIAALYFRTANQATSDDGIAGIASDRKGWLSGTGSWVHVLAPSHADTDTVLVAIPISAAPTDTDSVFVQIHSLSNPAVTVTVLTRVVLPTPTGVPGPVPGLPTRVALSAPRPNPFRAATHMELALPRDGRADVGVFDLAGRRVSTLLARELAAGRHAVDWDGRATTGARIGAGVYFVRAVALGETRVVRVLLMR